MVDNRRKDLESTKEELLNQIDELKQQVFTLQFEKDVLEKANELLKKDEGITLKDLSNRDKSNTRFYFTPPQILQNALDLAKEKLLDTKETMFQRLSFRKDIRGTKRNLVLKISKSWLRELRNRLDE